MLINHTIETKYLWQDDNEKVSKINKIHKIKLLKKIQAKNYKERRNLAYRKPDLQLFLCLPLICQNLILILHS